MLQTRERAVIGHMQSEQHRTTKECSVGLHADTTLTGVRVVLIARSS